MSTHAEINRRLVELDRFKFPGLSASMADFWAAYIEFYEIEAQIWSDAGRIKGAPEWALQAAHMSRTRAEAEADDCREKLAKHGGVKP